MGYDLLENAMTLLLWLLAVVVACGVIVTVAGALFVDVILAIATFCGGKRR